MKRIDAVIRCPLLKILSQQLEQVRKKAEIDQACPTCKARVS